jgi:hypothetical protein
MFRMKQSDMIRWEFRTVKGGEESEPIMICLGCGENGRVLA